MQTSCRVACACVAGRRRGEKESRGAREFWEGRRERPARTLLLLVFFAHQTNVRILIGKILRITQSVVLIGQQPVIREHRSSHIHSKFKILADGLNIFTQDFAAQLPYVTFRFTWETLQTSLQLFSFLGRPLYAFSIFQRSSNYFIFGNINNKKYPLNSYRQWRDSDWIILTSRHSTVEWVSAYLIRGPNEENNWPFRKIP